MKFIVEPENTIGPQIWSCNQEQYCFECYEDTASNDIDPNPWKGCWWLDW